MIRKLLLAIVLSTVAGFSVAAEQADKLPSILDQQRALQSDLADGKDLGLTPRQLSAVRNAQDQVFKLTEGKTSMDQLSIEDKIRLENALERINTQVKGGDLDHVAKGEQDICKRQRRAGSTVKVTVCATQAEWDRLRAAGREMLEKQRVCEPPGCGQ